MELSLYAALKRDPQGLALHFYRNGEPRGDVQGEEALISRYYLWNSNSEHIKRAISHFEVFLFKKFNLDQGRHCRVHTSLGEKFPKVREKSGNFILIQGILTC